jgi:hypothetical protein
MRKATAIKLYIKMIGINSKEYSYFTFSPKDILSSLIINKSNESGRFMMCFGLGDFQGKIQFKRERERDRDDEDESFARRSLIDLPSFLIFPNNGEKCKDSIVG